MLERGSPVRPDGSRRHARESARPDRLFVDPWAAALAGSDGFDMLAAREPDGRENAFLPVRTRFFDDLVNDAAPRGCRARCEPRAVPADLQADWAPPPLAAGFDPARPTVWVAEGLLFYFSAPEVHDLFRTAASRSAGGAVFGADLVGSGLLRLPGMRALVEHRTSTGTPMPYCTDAPGELLTSAG
jgi:O-methyltransferase involved in polyketide biosynthesis